MRWLIRWTDFRTFRDYEEIVDANSREEAEAIAAERKLTLTHLGPADGYEGAAPPEALSCAGHRLRPLHVALLVLCGIATIAVLLQSSGMLAAGRMWLPF